MSAPTAPTTGGTGETGEPADITVHRCTVTVVRRGGWSWGPDPRALVSQVVDSLPELLADHFAERLGTDGPDVEITEPLTVTVRPGRLGSPGRTIGGGPPVEVHFAPVPVVEMPVDAPHAPDTDTGALSIEESFAAEPDPWTAPSAAVLFTELAERGELDALLALLPEESVRAYLPALLEADATTAARLLAELVGRTLAAAPAEAVPEPLRTVLADADPTDLPRALAAYLASVDPEETIRAARTLTVPPTRADRGASEPPTTPGRIDEPPSAATTAAEPAAAGGTARAPRTTGEVRVWSALPFLLAGPLARIGYLDAIGPALAGIELAEDAPLFATSLAYKVLGATARAWRRTERDTEAAAAFAGLHPPVPEEHLTAFARHVRPALPVLDGVLALSVCRGHDPADPLLIGGADDALLLIDAQGMFPIAWAADAAGLLPHWQACGRPTVLLCDGPLPPGTLRELASGGVPFLTGVRPLRGDPVTRLPWRTPLWAAAGTAPDLRRAAELPAHTERFADLLTALVAERRAVPLAPDGGLERTVTLAAALGLSTIAWTLWSDRETPDPLLALRRFADLEATVRFEPAAVRVRVPMGRRHADLLRGGLLADVPDVVWLGGRTLTFSAG
ncbi:hypothetical protein [Streptomyces botrytidirepellens]|uniref:Uncharacterized protein n=1 Tax=Streptomyces botrytidirepellens TaxID=2486417 RepID=A0A3M8VTP3_9ACTN|nr:hypothetical protein [Streptomyces botrytidirepellens]RNG19625.1 hypothetical protein EEJ42_24595 [Streptomyces botrytidirepellens]